MLGRDDDLWPIIASVGVSDVVTTRAVSAQGLPIGAVRRLAVAGVSLHGRGGMAYSSFAYVLNWPPTAEYGGRAPLLRVESHGRGSVTDGL